MNPRPAVLETAALPTELLPYEFDEYQYTMKILRCQYADRRLFPAASAGIGILFILLCRGLIGYRGLGKSLLYGAGELVRA